MKIYAGIQKASQMAAQGIFQRLALATAIEHLVPRWQENPKVGPRVTDPDIIDPVERYLHFEKAFVDGELDPAFPTLTTWELRMVVNGDEPTWMLGWGREMLRNFHPQHIFTEDDTWRYLGVVGSDVKYGSINVPYNTTAGEYSYRDFGSHHADLGYCNLFERNQGQEVVLDWGEADSSAYTFIYRNQVQRRLGCYRPKRGKARWYPVVIANEKAFQREYLPQ